MTSEERLERIVGCSTIESHTKQWQEDYYAIKQDLMAMDIIRAKGIELRWAGAILFIEHTYDLSDEEEDIVRRAILNGE